MLLISLDDQSTIAFLLDYDTTAHPTVATSCFKMLRHTIVLFRFFKVVIKALKISGAMTHLQMIKRSSFSPFER